MLGAVDHLNIVVIKVNDKTPDAILRIVSTVPWGPIVSPSRSQRQLVVFSDSCLAGGRDGEVDASWLRLCPCKQDVISCLCTLMQHPSLLESRDCGVRTFLDINIACFLPRNSKASASA